MAKKKERRVITCEKVQGGFIFGVTSPHVAVHYAHHYRVVRDEADAITVFVGLIHGQKLDEITAHEEEKGGGFRI